MLIECPSCDAKVDGLSRGSFSRYREDLDDAPVRFTLLECPACHHPLVAEEEWVGTLGDEEMWDTPSRVLPPQDVGLSPSAPGALRRAYGEAQLCFRAKAYTAAAIMCRKTLEGICKEQNARARTLMASLKELRDKGVIDDRLYEWSDALRVTGNDAAHGVDFEVSREDAEDILGFTEALVDYVFVYRDRFDAFMVRRTKDGDPSSRKPHRNG